MGADLSDANLEGADLREVSHSFKRLRSIPRYKHPIVIIDNLIKVGRQTHSYEEWERFTTDEIFGMDREEALLFYPQLMRILEIEMDDKNV